VWTAVDSSLVSRLVLVDTGTNPDNPSTWTMTLSNYDGPVDVRAPIDCPTS
jgi:lipoprotein LprG